MGDNRDHTDPPCGEQSKGNENDNDNLTVVYVDGSCLENGKDKAVGSYGVFWGGRQPLEQERNVKPR